MTREQVIVTAILTVEEMRKEYVPYDTGNMALNALEHELDGDVLDITINPDIAPYVPYTNEPWLSPKWNGKKNPNEEWWGRFVAEFNRRMAIKLKGNLK